MWKKIAPNHPGKPLHSRANVRKKVPQAILARLYTPPPLRAMPMETTHLKKGFRWYSLPLTKEACDPPKIKQSDEET